LALFRFKQQQNPDGSHRRGFVFHGALIARIDHGALITWVLRRFQCKEAVNGFSFGSHKKNPSRHDAIASGGGRAPKGL
jgi:hypothetical protein